jgi:ABC-type hemin transport system ATPase subunit
MWMHKWVLAGILLVVTVVELGLILTKNGRKMVRSGVSRVSHRAATALSRIRQAVQIYYKKKLAIREQNYRNVLSKMRERLETLALEQRKVLDLVRVLRAQNIPIIIISHQLYDIFSVTDRLVIMRRGKKVAERNTKETTPDEVVGLITGSEEAARAGRAG